MAKLAAWQSRCAHGLLSLQANEQLDVVEKGLNDFLDTKKLAFPRFYFLSNDELLEILSEAKDPQNVQPFVKKCFEAVACLQVRCECDANVPLCRLFAHVCQAVPAACKRHDTCNFVQFEAPSGLITGIESVEAERVAFIEAVDPAETGAVEKWLLATESVIKRTLHKTAGDALQSYAQSERSKWILEWPGQLVLNCSQVYWTQVRCSDQNRGTLPAAFCSSERVRSALFQDAKGYCRR